MAKLNVKIRGRVETPNSANWLVVISGVAAILSGIVMLYTGLKGTQAS